ncbi:hypothetical protein OPQ81_000878 [Rhizoctonia solani]|nr:hypothetical protein OPQ81_000878 [Rhizoctonia solani]
MGRRGWRPGGHPHVRCELWRRTLADRCIREGIVPYRGVTQSSGTGPALGLDAGESIPRPNTLGDCRCDQQIVAQTKTCLSPLAPRRPLLHPSSAAPSLRRRDSLPSALVLKKLRTTPFLALLLPDSMPRFSTTAQDHWHRDDDRVTLPPIAEDRRASMPVPSTSGYVFTNTFESPRSPPYAPHRRPNLHNRTFSSPAIQGHNVHLRNNAIGLQDDALAFSPVPHSAMDWLGAGRQVARDDSSMSDFDPSAFGLDSGASSPRLCVRSRSLSIFRI